MSGRPFINIQLNKYLLHDLVPFVQFKNREKTPMEGCHSSKVACLRPATLLKVALLHGCFSHGFIILYQPNVRASAFSKGLTVSTPHKMSFVFKY